VNVELKDRMVCEISFCLAGLLFLIPVFGLPLEYNWLLNNTIPKPEWFRYSWWACSAIVFGLLLWKKQASGISAIMVTFFGPISLVTLGFVYIAKRLGLFHG